MVEEGEVRRGDGDRKIIDVVDLEYGDNFILVYWGVYSDIL